MNININMEKMMNRRQLFAALRKAPENSDILFTDCS